MIPIKLQMHNFLSFKEPAPLDFMTFNLAVLSGNNGVGKSSVLEAITWAIWGKTRASSDDDLIHQGTTGCWIEFIFEHEKNFYRIIRKRDKKSKLGQSFLEFQTRPPAQAVGVVGAAKNTRSKNLINDDIWESIAEATLKATQEKIIRILKIPYEIFVNSSYLRQGHADEFTIKTPAERKEILSEVLGLNYYEQISQKAREKLRLTQEKIKLTNFQIENLQVKISQKKEVENSLNTISNNYKKEYQKFTKIRQELLILEKSQKEYEVTKVRLNTLARRYQELKNDSDNLSSENQELLNEKKIILEKIKNKTKILDNYNNLLKLEQTLTKENIKFKKYSGIIQELKIIEHIKDEIKTNIARINKISNCPMCLRPMKTDESAKIVTHLKKEFREKYQDKLLRLEKELKNLNYNSNLHEKIQEKIELLSGARDEKQAVNLSENNLKNIQDNINKLVINNNKLKKEAHEIALEGKKQKQLLLKLEKNNLIYSEKKSQEVDLNNSILSLQSLVGGLKQEMMQIQSQEKDLGKFSKEILNLQKEVSNYEELSFAFGKKGIQAMIIEQSLFMIEENANELLKKITSDRMSLRFITQKEKKSGGSDDNLIETLDIKISDELGIRDYEMYSGGEAFRINFAIRIALSKLLASRAGTHLKFLSIDEGFGMLDSAGRDDLVAAINSISPDFEKILVITHLQELKDLFPTRIEVTKDSSGSHLEVINL